MEQHDLLSPVHFLPHINGPLAQFVVVILRIIIQFVLLIANNHTNLYSSGLATSIAKLWINMNSNGKQ